VNIAGVIWRLEETGENRESVHFCVIRNERQRKASRKHTNIDFVTFLKPLLSWLQNVMGSLSKLTNHGLKKKITTRQSC